jgi:hypothetical protein
MAPANIAGAISFARLETIAGADLMTEALSVSAYPTAL